MMNNERKTIAPRPCAPQDPLTTLATEWLSRRDAGFSPVEATEFAQWLSADPRHPAAVAEIERAWSLLAVHRDAGRADAIVEALAHRARARRVRRTRFTVALAGLAAAATLAFLLRPYFLPARATASPALPATVVLRPALQTLPDGSVVEFNAGGEIAVEYVAHRRIVRLLGGEAHFSVAKDPSRPFSVLVGNVEVRAVGTEFSVNRSAQNHKVEVLVNEGRVAVAPEAALHALEASAGSRVVVSLEPDASPTPVLTSISSADLAEALAWRGKRVEFNGTRLGEAVALFNAKNRVQLSLAEPGLASLRVSGTYWTNDPAGFARLVESSFGLRSIRGSDDVISLSR